MNQAKPYKIKAVEESISILTLLSQNKRGVSELARTLQLDKNKAFRILATFVNMGFVDQEEGTEQYYLTPKFKSIFAPVPEQSNNEIKQLANKILEQLY